ncbi:MAG: GerMN domain-containing protein [Acidimicrobiia bacterium]
MFVALVFTLVACGSDAGEVTTTAVIETTTSSMTTTTGPFTTTTGPTTTTTTVTPTTTTQLPHLVAAYFLHESGGSDFRMGPFLAPAARNADTLQEAIESLFGQTPSEKELGLTSEIPDGTRLLGVEVADDVATVNLSTQFADGGGTFSMQARMAQLVFTVTGFDTSVTGVRLQLDGQPVRVFSSEGLVLDDPMTRMSFRDVMPGILVEHPAFEEWTPPPVTVTGIAAAFEGVFQMEILDTNGRKVADVPYVQTTDGMDWGYFSVTFQASDLPPMPAELSVRVYELSAKDGTVINERIQPFGYRMSP